MTERIKLTDDDIDIDNVGNCESPDNIWITIGWESDTPENTEKLQRLKQQILSDQEKAKQLDYLISYYVCDNFEQLDKLMKERSHQLIDMLGKN